LQAHVRPTPAWCRPESVAAFLTSEAKRGVSKNRHLLWYAVRNFLAAPAAVVS
jgi:hypothetical protein